jgi:hypothetical protein
MSSFDFADDESASKLASKALASMEGGGIELTDQELRVTMGDPPIFATAIPRASIRSAQRVQDLTGPTRGAHGRRGRWLVNRSGKDLVRLEIRPPGTATLTPPSVIEAPGKIVKFLTRRRTIKLRELTISASEPDRLIKGLGF